MARVIVSLLAQADTGYIIIDLAGKAGNGVAAKYAAEFEALYVRLAAHPDSGAPPCYWDAGPHRYRVPLYCDLRA